MSRNKYSAKAKAEPAKLANAPVKTNKLQSSERPVKSGGGVTGPKSKVSQLDRCHTNDISWYNKTPLFDDSTNLPFNRIVGDTISWNNPTWIDDDTRSAIPGIMTLHFIPGIGWATDVNSPVNRAFNSMYQAIYSRTTGAMQFQQADLAFFALSVTSIMTMIGMAKRALGLSMIYTSKNFYYPDGVLEGCGIEPGSVIGKQNDVRQLLNQLILNFNGAEIPSFVDLFKRHYSLSVNVWADEDSVEAQLYAFVPEGYYFYDDVAKILEYRTFKPVGTLHDPMNIVTLMATASQCLEAWRNSSNFGLINGAIARAYPENELLKLDNVFDTDIVVPVYDPVINWQISNACGVGQHIDWDSLDVHQNVEKNVLTWQPKMLAPTSEYANLISTPLRFINAPDVRDVSKDFIMESTRLINMVKYIDGSAYLSYCGTEIFTGMTIRTRYWDADENWVFVDKTYTESFTVVDAAQGAGTDIKAISRMTQFRNAPRIYVFYTNSDEQDQRLLYQGCIGDLHVYTTVDYDSYVGLSNAALQSMYLVQVVPKMLKA